MNWKEREKVIPKISNDKLKKRYIKEELMRYDMYIGRCNDIKTNLDKLNERYEYERNNPNCGGSIITVSESSHPYNNKVIAILSEISDVEDELKYYESKLRKMDDWLNFITPSQQSVIKTYVIEYQCQSVKKVSDILGISEETVKKHLERGINRIYTKFKNNL